MTDSEISMLMAQLTAAGLLGELQMMAEEKLAMCALPQQLYDSGGRCSALIDNVENSCRVLDASVPPTSVKVQAGSCHTAAKYEKEPILMTPGASTCVDAFVTCCEAIQRATLIHRVSRSDKEFHFQNWVAARLNDAGLLHDSIGRNSYPDFTLVNYPEGYEVKGLQWPGREANYDSNSRVPTGNHNGRIIYYVFGRYPPIGDDTEYPVVDLVICHGDFLNADHAYVHKNKSFRGFGSYGDLLVRDRKMYVAPTPFALTDGTTGQATLIAPSNLDLGERLDKVGELVRTESESIVIGYSFDLRSSVLTPNHAPNPSAGRKHHFTAYRLKGMGSGTVSMRQGPLLDDELPFGDDE